MNTTIYSKITETKGGIDKPVSEILAYIQSGRWKDKITLLRTEKTTNGKSELYKSLKKELPYFTVSGTFTHRSDNGLKEHSGLVAIDIDNIQNLTTTKEQIKVNPYTYAVFTSCSGNGLCAIIKINPESHYQSFENLSIYYTQTLHIEIDHLADVSRPRFISYDPDLYLNPDSKLFDLEYEKKEEIIYESFSTNQDTETSLTKAVEMVEKHHTYQDGQKHNYMVDLAKVSNKFGVDLSTLQSFVRASYPDWYQSPTNAVEHIYRTRKNSYGEFQQTTYNQKTQTRYQVKESEDDFIKKLSEWEADWSNPVPPPDPIVIVKGSIISSKGNLTIYSGQSKVGKSGVITAIKAGSMPLPGINIDTLGFDVVPNKGNKLLLNIDTEQSKSNFFKNYKDVVYRSGRASPPDWFKSLWFTMESTNQLLDYTWKSLEVYNDRLGGVYHIIVDGIADYVNSALDDVESKKVVKEFRDMSVEYDCPLSTALHVNFGSQKQVGHLGSFGRRKGESIILIERENNISRIKFDLLRNGGEVPDIEFKYNKEKGYHTFIGYADNFQAGNEDRIRATMQNVLSIHDLPLKELEKEICETELIPPGRARTMIRKAREEGIIIEIQRGTYSLVKEFQHEDTSKPDYTPF